jgi:hypothetical protein
MTSSVTLFGTFDPFLGQKDAKVEKDFPLLKAKLLNFLKGKKDPKRDLKRYIRIEKRCFKSNLNVTLSCKKTKFIRGYYAALLR